MYDFLIYILGTADMRKEAQFAQCCLSCFLFPSSEHVQRERACVCVCVVCYEGRSVSKEIQEFQLQPLSTFTWHRGKKKPNYSANLTTTGKLKCMEMH